MKGPLKTSIIGADAKQDPMTTVGGGAVRGSIGVAGKIVFQLGHVGPNSPAAAAGLQKDDLILKINGVQVTSLDDVQGAFLESDAGTTFEVNVLEIQSTGRQI